MARGAKPVVKKKKENTNKKKTKRICCDMIWYLPNTGTKESSESEDSEPEAPKYLTNEFLGQLNDKKQKQITRKQKGTGEAEEYYSYSHFTYIHKQNWQIHFFLAIH